MEFLPECEQLVECPYNKAHQVVSHRLAKHLIKCKRSHGGVGFRECRFNSTHVMREEELAEHQAQCPDRLMSENFLNDNRFDASDTKITCVSSVTSVVNNDEDNWDDIPPVKSYNPRKKCELSNVLRDVKHGTPAQRRQEREKEAHRLNAIRGVE